MIRLKQLLIDIGVTMDAFTTQINSSKKTSIRVLSRGQIPKRPVFRNRLKELYEGWVARTPAAMAWLDTRGLEIGAIWDRIEGGKVGPRGGDNRIILSLGNPVELETRKDIEMILGSTMKHFKMFKSPFMNDVTSEKDIFLSQEHRFLKEMMLDSARYCGFIAVVGGVGSGKSVIRKSVAAQLMHDGMKVVFPLIIDKSRITPSSLIDAIVMDISDEPPKQSLEQKSRQAVRLLKARAENGMRQVLMIEEAHRIDKRAFKALKQIYELEAGFEKMIGIILIGQPELLKKLDEIGNSDIREVIQRITTAEIEGLGEAVKPYLAHKFKRVGKNAGEVLADDAYDAINTKLERTSGRRKVNRSFPLSVNNLVARAMNMAQQMGEEKVTADLIFNC